jgi:hypothetical protein
VRIVHALHVRIDRVHRDVTATKFFATKGIYGILTYFIFAASETVIAARVIPCKDPSPPRVPTNAHSLYCCCGPDDKETAAFFIRLFSLDSSTFQMTFQIYRIAIWGRQLQCSLQFSCPPQLLVVGVQLFSPLTSRSCSPKKSKYITLQAKQQNMKSSIGYISNLTPLRGFAALMVVIYHFEEIAGRFVSAGDSMLIRKSYLMVDLFFIMSGFIIFHVYSKEFRAKSQRNSFSKFLVARFARIYPLHFFMLLICVLIIAMAGVTPVFNPAAIPTHILLLQSFGIHKFIPKHTIV